MDNLQLAIYDSYNGNLVYDFTQECIAPEFTTNKYGFGYCKFGVTWDLSRVAPFFKFKKQCYVRIGNANESFFEGRLEDVELGQKSIFTAFGYWRAFADVQFNDLWSTTDVSRFKTATAFSNGAAGRPEKFTIQNQNGILYFSLQKNTDYTGNYNARQVFVNPIGSQRKIQAVNFTFQQRNTAATTLSAGLQDSDQNYRAGTTNYFLFQSTVSGAIIPINAFVPNLDAISFFMGTPFAALFVGENGNEAISYYNVRVGTTPSISGARLYADEILRYTASGVNTLNANMISQDFSAIQSPRYDLTDIEFIDKSGIDVIETLLKYPDYQGNLYEFRVWENQQIIFRPITSNRTWYVDLNEIKVKRTMDTLYSQVRTRYKGVNEYQVWSTFTRNSNYPYTIERQKTIQTDLLNPDTSAIATAFFNDQNEKERYAITVENVVDLQGRIRRAYYVRSGDTIILRNIPPYLFDAINSSFVVDETIAHPDTGKVQLVPKNPTPELDALLAKIKL